MTGNDAPPARPHGQGAELAQPASWRLRAMGPPQHPSVQSRSPQLLVRHLYTSASDPQAVLGGLPVSEDIGHEGRKGSMGQSGELVEQCPQHGTQDAGIDWVVAGAKQDQTQNDVLDLQNTMLEKLRGGNVCNVTVVGFPAVEDDKRRTARSWAAMAVLELLAVKLAASCRQLVGLGSLQLDGRNDAQVADAPD